MYLCRPNIATRVFYFGVYNYIVIFDAINVLSSGLILSYCSIDNPIIHSFKILKINNLIIYAFFHNMFLKLYEPEDDLPFGRSKLHNWLYRPFVYVDVLWLTDFTCPHWQKEFITESLNLRQKHEIFANGPSSTKRTRCARAVIIREHVLSTSMAVRQVFIVPFRVHILLTVRHRQGSANKH